MIEWRHLTCRYLSKLAYTSMLMYPTWQHNIPNNCFSHISLGSDSHINDSHINDSHMHDPHITDFHINDSHINDSHINQWFYHQWSWHRRFPQHLIHIRNSNINDPHINVSHTTDSHINDSYTNYPHPMIHPPMMLTEMIPIPLISIQLCLGPARAHHVITIITPTLHNCRNTVSTQTPSILLILAQYHMISHLSCLCWQCVTLSRVYDMYFGNESS